jgi:hypothetical protein
MFSGGYGVSGQRGHAHILTYTATKCRETAQQWKRDYVNIKLTSMLLPGDPGSIGIHIYVFTVESQQLVGARHTSCTQLLWKPRDPGREDTHILVTVET